MDLEQRLIIYFVETRQNKVQPCVNTSAVCCFWSGKELLLLAVLCDRTMLLWLNQSFSGSR